MKRKPTSSASVILRRRYGLKRKPKPEVIGGRGWVPVCPPRCPGWEHTAGPWWAYVQDTRVAVARDVAFGTGESWSALARKGWRIVRCRVEEV